MGNEGPTPTAPSAGVTGAEPGGLPGNTARARVPDGAEGAPVPTSPDPVEEAGEESFPASDPPAWTGTTAD